MEEQDECLDGRLVKMYMQHCRISKEKYSTSTSLCLSSLFSLPCLYSTVSRLSVRACALRERWKDFFGDHRLCPYFLNKAVGESRTCGDTLEMV